MNQLVWNKDNTKARVYSTIAEGYLTGFKTVTELRNNPVFRDLILLKIDKICPCCKQSVKNIKAKE